MHEILTIMPSVSAIFRYIYTKKDYSLPFLKGQGKREKTLKSGNKGIVIKILSDSGAAP